VIVERNHVNLKKALFYKRFEGGRCSPARRFIFKEAMHFFRLTPLFYAQYGQYEEILNKESRPYYVLLLEVDALTYAIPLRSHITHPYCHIAGNAIKSGLDYSKAVIITDRTRYVDPAPVTIRQNEFDVLKQRGFLITKQFTSYVSLYKKEIRRRLQNPALPESGLCRYSSLKYFHKELELGTPIKPANA
jgi:protein AbiQ